MRSPPERRGNGANTRTLVTSTAGTQASRVLETLGNVLREAQARGIDLSASFLHFDRRHQGLVGVDDFMSAIVELRVVALSSGLWGEADAEECVFQISARRSRAYFSRDDFVIFFAASPVRNDENWYSRDDGISPSPTNAMETKKPVKQELSPTEGRGGVRAGFSLSNNDDRPFVVEPKTKGKRPLGSLLPNWAHARSKRALKELEQLSKKRRHGGASRPPSRVTVVTERPLDIPPLGFHIGEEQDEDIDAGDCDKQRVEASARSVSTASGREDGEEEEEEEPSTVIHFPVGPTWKLFDLDRDTTLSYAILTHDTLPAPHSASPRKLPRALSVSPADEEAAPVWTPFRFTVLLDAFQRIETLEAFFAPLLTHFPRGKILICGFPTKMRRQTVLNNEFLAAAYAKLLAHLADTTREWLAQPKLGVAAMPQFVMGFGSGAQVALRLLGSELPLQAGSHPCLLKFLNAQRGLVLFNAVVGTSDHATRLAWNSWRRLLTTSSSSVEWHEMLLRTMFSEFYLTQVAQSREHAMEQFLQSRRQFLQGQQLELMRSLVRGVLKSRDCVVECLGNISSLCKSPFGVIVVHGSIDELASAAQVEVVEGAFPAKVDSVRDCLSVNMTSSTLPLTVAWLKSGHEITQERGNFVHDLMRQLVLTPVTLPSAVDTSAAMPVQQPIQNVNGAPSGMKIPDIDKTPQVQPFQLGDVDRSLDVVTHGNLAIAVPEPTLTAIGVRVRQLMDEKGLKWIQQELYDRDLEGSGKTEVIIERYEQVLLAEARREREQALKELEKQRKRANLDVEKRARQLEELERVVREQEIEKRIKHEEYEAQKRFFELMEKEKETHAKWLDEHRQMELEDALSLKLDDLILLEEARDGRNKQMGRKVAALELERQEQEQNRFRVALQQERLGQQQNKREELKKFQREFEQNQFVCSAVEAYQLDTPPEYANFAVVVDGVTLLANDLTRFYEAKVSRMEDSVEKRQQLQVLKQEAAEKELVLRNLERVLIKAKSTGMIAKAGLGTVRVVPISAAETQALTRELDERRDEVARLMHDQNLLVQQVAWQDKMLQRLSVLIKRNEGFRGEMLPKLTTCADKGNEMVLCVREDMESLFETRESNAKLVQRIKVRLQLVNDEMPRAEASTTQYFDTRTRIEGTTQRVIRTVLLKELAVEREELEKRMTSFALEDTHIRILLKDRKLTLDEYAAVTFKVEQAKTTLVAAVPPPSRVAATNGTGMIDGTTDEVADGSGLLGDRARHKKHNQRSVEEKQWIALDFEMNFAYYYKHMDSQEIDIIQKHPDYQNNKLKKPQLERLLTLPARNCLALAFLTSKEELEAFSLLRKYTIGDGDEYFARLDREFEVPASISPAATVVSTLEELILALEKVENPMFRTRSALLLKKRPNQAPLLRIFSAGQQQIPPHKSVTHSFHLPTGSVGVLSLTVSIVFQGHFKSTGYQNGRVAAMLYVLPSPTTTSISAPLPIGKCLSTADIALCTPHSLGKVILRHDPAKKPLDADVTYQVVLGAPVPTTYSIEITAHTAVFPCEVLRKKKADALKKQELLPMKKDEIQNVFTTIQLSERKKRLARKMANEAKDSGRQAELEMLRQSKLLEADNAVPKLSQDERKTLHAKIHAAESQFTHQCFLFAQREEEVRDIEAGLKELTKIHADLLEEVDHMEQDLVAYRENLPSLAAVLVDSRDNGDRDAAGARVARELNIEYVSRYGARSGKVFWAEISAMKTKLPSMMTPAERLRRKYKKGVDVLEKKEREWILLDRILYPRRYDWEDRLVAEGNYRMRLHGTYPKLTKDEEQLAVLSQMEVERVMKAPWNLLERKEIQVRKIVTRFRDESGAKKSKSEKPSVTTMTSMLRSQRPSDLTSEEREWRVYDQLLNPIHYPMTLKNIAQDLAYLQQNENAIVMPVVPSHITREDLVLALNTPEEELFKLPSDLLHARNLLLKYDPHLSMNLMEVARMQHAQANAVTEKVEMDVDARCRLVYAELQRAIANTRNEFMDSSVLHTTLQRFPTKVLRLELEKELDRLVVSQIVERESYELINFLKAARGPKKQKSDVLGGNGGKRGDDDTVFDSDSDEEAQIAREQREQKRIKEAAKKGPRDKVRGKALKAKTIQKQRREIRDALQGRSLEEQRRLLDEQELGVGGCMACKANPCVWKPYLQESYVSIQSRMEVLQEELERVKRAPDLVVESTVCLAAVKSGNRAVVMRKVDLFDEVTLELKIWDKNLQLRAVDKEFHDTFTSREAYFETQTLHGFRQIQQRDKVQRALQREHNVLVSNLTAFEVVEDVLESMLEGWVFGERESERKAVGFVPSLQRDGPLTMQDLRRLEQEKKVLDARASLVEEENVQGVPLDKWKPIGVAAFEINEKNKAVKKGSELDRQLTETENALKFGIFSMTLMYFRGLSLLKKQKTVWSTSALKGASLKQSTKSDERKRMEMEARNVVAREKKARFYDDKSRVGQARKQKLEEQRTAAYRRRMVLENQKAKREATAAVQIQRVFRGFMGRRAGRKWMLRRREIDAQRALTKAAAMTLQRAYRGRLGRQRADERRIELAEFISQIRAEEAIEEEEEYWKRHRVERVARQVAAFVKKQA